MPVEFHRVEEVEAGQRVSSRNMRQLAGAVRERVLSGLGDVAWRYVWWWTSLARQIRMPDQTQTIFPPQGEWLQGLHLLDPDDAWPNVGPGEPHGINRATAIGSYVFGLGDVDPEDVRMTDPSRGGVPMEYAETPAEIWELGKRQRGAYDAATGAMGAPAWEAGISHYGLIQAPTSIHGQSYGGWFPTPTENGDCLDGTTDRPPTLNVEIKFTRIRDGFVRVYPGTCPENPEDVARVFPGALGYYVVRYSGAVEYLPRNEWIEGPYNGGRRLSRAEGGHMPRMLNRFAGEFRGDQQRHAREKAGLVPPLGKAFDVKSFFLRQYLLAPARGAQLSEDSVTAVYPRVTLNGATSAAAGTRVGSVQTAASGFVWAAFCVRTTGIQTATRVQLRQGSTVVGEASVSPAAPDAICILSRAVGGAVQVVLPDGTRFVPASGRMSIELAELWEYLPQTHDLMTVLRLAGARESDAQGTDGSGLAEADARSLWRGYAANGCIVRSRDDGELPGSEDAIGTNAVYDLARRWAQTVRTIPQHNLVAYSVEDGDSVLWLDPVSRSRVGGRSPDLLQGMTGEIREKALPNGWSNRWCVVIESARYQNFGSSIWNEVNLADQVAFTDRCVHWTPILPQLPAHLQRHFNGASDFAARRSYAPEVASGYRYVPGVNATAAERHYRSCPIYKPPTEVRSATAVTVAGRSLVKIVLNGRLQHHHSLAPAEIGRDVSGWDRAAVAAEAADYRTDENAIREYLIRLDDPTLQCEPTGPGNADANSDILLGTDVPWGACIPRLHLVQLPGDPYQDGNDEPDEDDTVLTHEEMAQIELWARVASEGCVDGQATSTYGCEVGIDFVFDFRYEALCFQATGRPWVTTLPTTTTKGVKANQTRPDGPQGFGPLPTCLPTAEGFNQLARIWNAMHSYRVSLPWKFEVNFLSGEVTRSVSDVFTASGAPKTCPGDYNPGFIWTGNAGNPGVAEVSGWIEAGTASSSFQSGFGESGGAYVCDGTDFTVASVRNDQDYRFTFVDPDAIYAVPSAWRDQLNTSGRLLATLTTTVTRVRAAVGSTTPSTCNANTIWIATGGAVEWVANTTEETLCDFQPATGRISTPPLGVVTLPGGNGTPICNGIVSTTQTVLNPIPTDAIIFRVPLIDPEP
jgi:hypothetical protein